VKFAKLENMVYEPKERITVYSTRDQDCASFYGVKDHRTVTLTLFLKEVHLQNNVKLDLPDLIAWTTAAVCDEQKTFSRRVLHSSII